MLDNLRRTLSAPAIYLALLAGWMLPLGAAVVWTAFVVATFAIPAFIPAFVGIIPRRFGLSQRRHWYMVGADFALASLQLALLITLVASQAWLMADAILRTLFRLFIRRRKLLEWVTAAQSKVSARLGLFEMYLWMSGGVGLAVFAGVIVGWAAPASWPIAAPFIILWILSPAIALWASLPLFLPSANPVTGADAQALRLTARRTWRFFETFVTAEEHALPPDNFQEDPKPMIAHRTSPTNMGLYLLSVVAARDFGWIGTHDAVDRLEATLGTMKSLERYRGHFYNWYDTRELRPLEPRYISAVDSGNLAGHLIALRSACREMIDGPPACVEWLQRNRRRFATHARVARFACRGSPDSHCHAKTLGGCA